MAIARPKDPPEGSPEHSPEHSTHTAPGSWPKDYQLRQGSGLERSRLLQMMRRTYRELYPDQDFDHLAHTVEAYFSRDTPLWWLDAPEQSAPEQSAPASVGCLWMGTAVDQVRGDRHGHIFLLYIAPEHRRQGLGRQLMQVAEAWAVARGDRKLSLQVFSHNTAALALYQSLGYQPQSVALIKSLPSQPP
ncbi:MAG: GNAT family N-acetyltransferase [Synechococcales cyanobacterium RU_4_20]|nr:GNAT family N-acetyltransferase [Synechococcales cyanobacterium RU_4_20]NJR70179.1 GNAT family N-acetyltransferase [Synechococcales cyanobacterium CRU_2_2]